MGEFVDDDQLGLALERRVQIKFIERAPVVFDFAPRQDFEAFDERARFGAAMSLDEPHDDIDALVLQALRVLQHGVGFADSGRGAEKNLQPASGLPAERRQQRVGIGASGVRSAVGWGHWRSWVVMMLLTHPALNSAAKR